MENVRDTARRIARIITHEPTITDEQIVTVARAQGCKIPQVSNLNDLDMMGGFLLGKHMVTQAEIAGLSFAAMAGTEKPRYV